MDATFGRLLSRTYYVNEVNETENTAEIKEVLETLATYSVGVSFPQLAVASLNASQIYTLSESAARQQIQTQMNRDSPGDLDVILDAYQAFAFPPTAMQPNKRYTVEMDSLVNNLPPTWQETVQLQST